MDRDRELLDGIGPRRLTADEIKQLLTQKGWLQGNLALWLGVSRIHLGRLIRDVRRPRHWDLAFMSLPHLTTRENSILTDLRLAREREQKESKVEVKRSAAEVLDPAATASGPGYRYRGVLVPGAVVVVTASHVGEMAEEGEEGEVVAVRDAGGREDYLIRFLAGEDWFDPDSFDACMAETGKEV